MQHSTLTEQARHWAVSQPEQVWMRDLAESGATEYTWGAAVAEIDRVAAWLEAAFGHGERMALLSRNRAHWIMADMGIIHSGNVTVPLFTTHAQATAEYILGFTDTKVLFLGETENWHSVKEVLPEGCVLITLPGVGCDLPHTKWEDLVAAASTEAPSYKPGPDDVVSLVFTSGTTGLPKGVIQTHDTNLIPMRRCQYLFTQREQPRWFSYLPLSHIAERQIVEFSSINTGARSGLTNRSRRWHGTFHNAGPTSFSVHPGFGSNSGNRLPPSLGAQRHWQQRSQATKPGYRLW